MTIVVIDDSAVALAVLKNFALNGGSHEVVAFSHAPNAIDYLREHSVDAIVVDYSMPEMNGVEFTQGARAMAAHAATPIIMVTASNDAETRAQAQTAGVTEFLHKPVRLDQFKSVLRAVLKV